MPPPVSAKSEEVIADVASADTLGALHAALVRHRILGPEARFLQFEFDITSKCNLRCRMCYFSIDEIFFAKPVYLAPEHLGRLTPWFDRAHTVTLSLGNEPLTSPHFISILERIAPARVPNVTFYTNGVLFSQRTIDAVLDLGVTQVCLSADGARRETFEDIRRGASFDRFVSNVRALTAGRRRRGQRTPALRLNVVLMQRNLPELPSLVDLAASLEIAEINFCHVVSYDGLAMDGESLRHVPEAWNEMRDRVITAAALTGVRITAIPPPFGTDADRDLEAMPASAPTPEVERQTPYCLYPFFHVSMDAGGHVLACPFAHGEAPYGRLDEAGATIESIWLNDAFRTLRSRILRDDPPSMCRRCAYLANRHPDRAALFATRPWEPATA